jgi:hypothetical protein
MTKNDLYNAGARFCINQETVKVPNIWGQLLTDFLWEVLIEKDEQGIEAMREESRLRAVRDLELHEQQVATYLEARKEEVAWRESIAAYTKRQTEAMEDISGVLQNWRAREEGRF